MAGEATINMSKDGSLDWSLGVDSLKVPTVQSQLNPNGLERQSLSWLVNGTVRDGGISPRWGWQPMGSLGITGLFQGSACYQPVNGSTPYYIASIGGHIYQIFADDATNPVDLGLGVQDNYPPGTPSTISNTYTVVMEWSYLTPTDVQVGDTIADTNLNVNGLGAQFASFVIPEQNVPVYVTITEGQIPSSNVFAGNNIQIWLSTGAHGGSNVATNWNVIAVIPAGIIERTVIPLANIVNPPGNAYSYFCQAEQFMIIQAGDYTAQALSQADAANGYYIVQITPSQLTTPQFTPGGTIGANGVLNGSKEGATVYPMAINGFNCNFQTFTIPSIGTSVAVSCQVGEAPTQNGTLLAPGDTIEIWVGTQPTYSSIWTVNAINFYIPNQYPTLPLFWDGTTLWRSMGITTLQATPGQSGVNYIPPGGPMVYYMGRLWYAQDRTLSAGDIVGGPSGTLAYNFMDSLLQVTENPLATGGDGFTMPAQTGNITGLSFLPQLLQTFGQGPLIVYTPGGVYQGQIPVTRALWIAANASNQPLFTIVQNSAGSTNDRSIVPYNGDLFSQTYEPGIRSLINAIRYFDTWGNTPISSNEDRIWKFTNTTLLNYASGIIHDSRLLMTGLPQQTALGVTHQVLMPLDFTPLNVFQKELPPTWEGHYEGLNWFQLVQGSYSGKTRSFGFVLSEAGGGIELWELTTNQTSDNVVPNSPITAPETRITTIAEFPAFNHNLDMEFKEWIACEMWIDSLYGEVEFEMDYRIDSDLCWHPWAQWKLCSARNSAEFFNQPSLGNNGSYPLTPYRSGYRTAITLPTPQPKCQSTTGRPMNVGYCIQPRLRYKGWCRIRGLMLYANLKDKATGYQMVCKNVLLPGQVPLQAR